MQNEKALRRPIKYALIFSACTILLFFFGPFQYPDINRRKLIIFLIAANLGMFLGFYAGTKFKIIPKRRTSLTANLQNPDAPQKFLGLSAVQILNILFWISFIICIPKFILYSGAYELNLSALAAKVQKFFTSAQEIYSERQSLKSVTGVWRYINYLVVLAGPFYWAYTPLALLYWKKLTAFKKIGTVFIWFLYLLQYLVTGTNVGFFDFFLTVLVVILVKNTLRGREGVRSKKIRNLILFILIFFILFSVFDIVMGSRIGDQYLKGGHIGIYRYKLKEDSIIWRYSPDSLKSMTAYLTRYLSNSYNAIALAIDMPFQTTFGLGHSWFVLDNLSTGLSKGLWSRTYNMKIEAQYNYGHYANWHTAYLWFANDVSFIGVPVLFLFLFYYFGSAWRRFLAEKDLFCFLRFMIFVKLCYFLSANNQIFQNSDTLLAFWGLALLTLLGKKCTMESIDNEI